MSIDLGRRLIAAGLVSSEEVEAALFLSVAKGVPFPRVLLDRGAVTERGLEEELDRVGGLGLRQVAGSPQIWARLPRAMCRRLAALPTRVDPATGAVDVAAADPLDPHVVLEFGFHLGAPIRVLRAPIAAVEEAIRRLELEDTQVSAGQPVLERARHRRVTPPFPHGAPQSSMPPPVLDETPIPLVRKIPGHDDGSRPQTSARAGGTLVPPAGAPPLARLGITAPKPVAAIPPAPHTLSYPGTDPDEPKPRPAAAPRTAGELPSVSFPSVPPNGEGDRITPPYGTPLYDPLAAGRPPSPSPGYRIAPPDDDPYALHDGPLRPAPADRDEGDTEDASPPPPPSARPSPAMSKATLPSAAWPTGPRRPARPALGDVPYPAVLPAHTQAPATRDGLLAESDPPESAADDDEEVPLEVPRKVRAPASGPVLEALRQTTSRDEVIRVAMRGMRLVARRLAVFAVKRDGFYGWACNVELGDSEALRGLRIPEGLPSVLATATATALYLGPIPPTPAHEGLLQVMERASSDVAAVAVRVAGRPALVLLCDELDDTMVGTRFLIELGRAVGEALARLLAPR